MSGASGSSLWVPQVIEPLSAEDIDERKQDRVTFMPPTEGLVTSYAESLRSERKHKGGGIRVYIGSIGAVLYRRPE